MALPSFTKNEQEHQIHPSLDKISDVAFEKAQQGSRGEAGHRIDNWFEWARQERQEAFEKPTLKGFMGLVSHIEEKYMPELVGRAVLFRNQNFEGALKESTEIGFMIRHLAVREMLESPSISEEAKEQITIAHLALTNHQITEIAENLKSIKTGELRVARAMCITNVASFGAKNPEKLEEIFTQLSQTFVNKRSAFKKLSDRAKNGDINCPESSARNFAVNHEAFLRGQLERFEATRLGTRAEVITALLMDDLLKSEYLTKEAEKFGYTSLKLARPSPEFDARGLADYVLTGETAEHEDALVCIEVKLEPKSAKLNTIGTLTKRRVKTPEGFGVDTANSDNVFYKPAPEVTDYFVKETGIPVLSVRIPREWVLDTTGTRMVRGQLVKSLRDIAAGNTREANEKDALASKDILKYSLTQCLKYRKEAEDEPND